MDDRIRRAWRTNATINDALITHLTPDMLDVRMPGDGWTIALTLAHMQGSVTYWASHLDPGRMAGVPALYEEDARGEPVAERDLATIRAGFGQAADAAWSAVAASSGGRGRLPHADGHAMLLHMMVHDAHHRGQILVALKTAGFELPSDDDLWAPWRRN